MSLGADIQSELPRLREYAESLMVDECRVTRPDPDAPAGGMDPETGQYPERPRITIYEGKCRLQDNRVQVTGEAGSAPTEAVIIAQAAEIQLPIGGSESVAQDDVIEMVACANDPAAVGRLLTVSALHHKTHATSRRLRVEEATG